MRLVSVIIPNYNYAVSLPLCIEAIRKQTYPNVEVIMVDDRSTDDSVAIAERLGVKVLHTPVNSGCATARNLGVAASNGEILMFVDSDVALHPQAIEKAVFYLDQDQTLGAVCGVHDPEPLIRDSMVEEYRALQYHYWSISSEGRISFMFPAVCAIERAVFDEIGPFNTKLTQTEEVDYGNRLTQRYGMLLTSQVRARHDHDDELVPLLRKLYRRARARVPLYARRKAFATGFETSNRAFGSVAALGAVATLPLVALLGPWALLLTGAALGASLAADLGMYRFVRKSRGVGFLLYFAAVHFAVNVTIATGVAVGALKWLGSARFRRLYDPVPA
ncbi:glycosyltransferase [Actinoplanes sp. NEAU-A12]|uniref:Glycosyltransferase n=1 Tax=Actinoplanes sandaracinus TaxID=3045177 RepID=A0ABT6WI41_9ACTN|nr:glycosyltransferase [Actinoplanes sandaracinus]MDI6099385.1 glycosyltransferase [Actinoplanes sandaracinus]